MRRSDAMVKGGAPSADLFVCFPHCAHLTVIPAKAIFSPGRPLDQPCPHHRRGKSSFNSKVHQASPSPVLCIKAKHTAAALALEPTSPKVICVGQIKVKNKNGNTTHPCRGWQSFMHEIGQINKNENRKKRPTLGEALVFNKDAMQFLTCLWSLKFNFRCFGNFPAGEITSDLQRQRREEEGRRKNAEEGLVTACFNDKDYYRISTNLARETWIVGGFREVFSCSFLALHSPPEK